MESQAQKPLLTSLAERGQVKEGGRKNRSVLHDFDAAGVLLADEHPFLIACRGGQGHRTRETVREKLGLDFLGGNGGGSKGRNGQNRKECAHHGGMVGEGFGARGDTSSLTHGRPSGGTIPRRLRTRWRCCPTRWRFSAPTQRRRPSGGRPLFPRPFSEQ